MSSNPLKDLEEDDRTQVLCEKCELGKEPTTR